jgi:hypothetical protein
MATSITTSLPMWLAGCTYDANGGVDLRNSHVTSTFYDSGIAAGNSTIGVLSGVVGGTGLKVTAGTGLQVSVAPGSFVVANSGSPAAGGYVSTLASSGLLTVAAGNPSNPRVDIVVAYVDDTGTSASFGQVDIISGTPAPSPAAPSAPSNSITLARISVAADASSVTSGMITDTRTYTTTAGGVLVAAQGTVAGYNGCFAYDPVAGIFYHNSASGPVPFTSEADVPSINVGTSPFTFSGNETQYTTAGVNTDGDVSLTLSWPGVSCSRGSTFSFNVQWRFYLDGVQLHSLFTGNDPCDGTVRSGGTMTYRTSAFTGDTPSNGVEHGFAVTVQNMSGAYSTEVYASSDSKIQFVVAPVPAV